MHKSADLFKKAHWTDTRGLTVSERLDFYSIPEPNTGCWIWVGSLWSSGYGTMTVNQISKAAHRWRWEICYGEIPKGMDVCHKCDVRLCTNPEHLFLGTRQDNMQDAIRKGRFSLGESHKSAKLTEQQVMEILPDVRAYNVIARDYEVSRQTIGAIKNGINWKHITRPLEHGAIYKMRTEG